MKEKLDVVWTFVALRCIAWSQIRLKFSLMILTKSVLNAPKMTVYFGKLHYWHVFSTMTAYFPYWKTEYLKWKVCLQPKDRLLSQKDRMLWNQMNSVHLSMTYNFRSEAVQCEFRAFVYFCGTYTFSEKTVYFSQKMLWNQINPIHSRYFQWKDRILYEIIILSISNVHNL